MNRAILGGKLVLVVATLGSGLRVDSSVGFESGVGESGGNGLFLAC